MNESYTQFTFEFKPPQSTRPVNTTLSGKVVQLFFKWIRFVADSFVSWSTKTSFTLNRFLKVVAASIHFLLFGLIYNWTAKHLLPERVTRRVVLHWLVSLHSSFASIRDLRQSFEDGVGLCFLLQILRPDCLDRVDLLSPTESQINLKLAAQLICTKFHISIAFEPTCLDEPTIRRLLIELRLYTQRIEFRRRLKLLGYHWWFERDTMQSTTSTQHMYARGMGLLVGVRNRPSTFIIYVTEPTSLVVELVGPNDLYACQRVITGEPVQAAGCRQTIAMQIKGQSNQISVQYIPPAAGNYVLSLVHAGSHVLDSPYNIQVDDMVQALPSDDRSTSTTVKEMDPVEIYQIKCADSTPLQSSSSLSNFRMCSLKQLKPTDCATMSDQSKVSTYVNTFAALNVNDSKASAVETKASEPNHAITSTARPVERLDESMELEQDQHSIETVSSSLSSISNVKSRLMVDTLEDLLEEGDPMGSNVERLFCDLYQTVVDEKATTSNESDKENQVQNEQLIVASSSNDSKLSKANSKVLADKHSERAKQSRTIMTTRSSGLNLNPQARSYLQLQKAAATHSTKLIEKNQSQSIRRQLPNEMCKKSISPTSGVSLSRRPRLQSPPTPVKEHNVVTVSLSMQQQSIEPLMPNESMLNRFMNCASPDITNQSVSQKKNFWESLCSKNVKNTSVRSTLRPCLTDQRRPSETPKPPKTQLCTSTVSRSLTKTISNSSSVNSPHKKPIHVMDSNRASVKKSEPTKTAPTSDFEVSSTMDLNFSPIAPSGENPALNLTTLMTLTQMENRLARLEQLNDLKLPSPPTLTGTVSPNTRPIAVSTLRRRPATTGPPAIKVRSPASSDSVDARLRSQTLSVTHCQAGGSALHHAQADVDNTFFVVSKLASKCLLSVGVFAGDSKQALPVLIDYSGDQLYSITFCPKSPGPLEIHIRWANQPIVGSPFHCIAQKPAEFT